MIKNIFIGVFVVATIVLGWFYYNLNSDYKELDMKYLSTVSQLEDMKISKQLLEEELNTQKEISAKHAEEIKETLKAHKELLDEIDNYSKVYQDWFNTDIPFDLDSLFNKTTDSDQIRSDTLHSTGESSR